MNTLRCAYRETFSNISTHLNANIYGIPLTYVWDFTGQINTN